MTHQPPEKAPLLVPKQHQGVHLYACQSLHTKIRCKIRSQKFITNKDMIFATPNQTTAREYVEAKSPSMCHQTNGGTLSRHLSTLQVEPDVWNEEAAKISEIAQVVGTHAVQNQSIQRNISSRILCHRLTLKRKEASAPSP